MMSHDLRLQTACGRLAHSRRIHAQVSNLNVVAVMYAAAKQLTEEGVGDSTTDQAWGRPGVVLRDRSQEASCKNKIKTLRNRG